jgi:hypothetical protein
MYIVAMWLVDWPFGTWLEAAYEEQSSLGKRMG